MTPEAQSPWADTPLAGGARASRTHDLECGGCGYGIAHPDPPERCPMCQEEGTWVHAPWRPFGGSPLPAARRGRLD